MSNPTRLNLRIRTTFNLTMSKLKVANLAMSKLMISNLTRLNPTMSNLARLTLLTLGGCP